jgi:hypothetical protein
MFLSYGSVLKSLLVVCIILLYTNKNKNHCGLILLNKAKVEKKQQDLIRENIIMFHSCKVIDQIIYMCSICNYVTM